MTIRLLCSFVGEIYKGLINTKSAHEQGQKNVDGVGLKLSFKKMKIGVENHPNSVFIPNLPYKKCNLRTVILGTLSHPHVSCSVS